jgi:hypothetical protein
MRRRAKSEPVGLVIVAGLAPQDATRRACRAFYRPHTMGTAPSAGGTSLDTADTRVPRYTNRRGRLLKCPSHCTNACREAAIDLATWHGIACSINIIISSMASWSSSSPLSSYENVGRHHLIIEWLKTPTASRPDRKSLMSARYVPHSELA